MKILDWGYNGRNVILPHNWGRVNSNCDQDKQSPINIVQRDINYQYGRSMLSWISGVNNLPRSVHAYNNGHTGFNKFK